MALSAKEPTRIIAVLKLPKHKNNLFILKATFIVASMTDNQWFPSPRPDLAVVRAAIDDLSKAQAVVVSGLKGSVAVREQKRQVVTSLLEQLRSHVQTVADANYENAAAIIESAGMNVKQRRTVRPRAFVAFQKLSGAVILKAPSAGDRAGYEFQYSLDGGVTWLGLPQQFTTKTTVTVTGLTRGSTVHFRYRPTVKGLTMDWSQLVSIIVE